MKFFFKNQNNVIIDFKSDSFDREAPIKFSLDFDNDSEIHPFFFYEYTKTFVKSRKINSRIKKGITKTEKKNSLKRDINNTTLQQYVNIMLVDGDKIKLFKNFDKAVESFFTVLQDEDSEFSNYRNFKALSFLSENFVEYNNFNYLLNIFLPKYYSIFDIKTKKNNKRSKSLKKYSHEISYVSEPKRLKNVLKVINVYSESFKSYELWERLFWVFLKVILNQGNKKSYLLNRRAYIYKKSIKFFSNTNNK